MTRRKKQAKGVTLNPSIWLRNSTEIRKYREAKLKEQDSLCAVSGVPIETGCLDHTHKDGAGVDGAVRGVLLSEVNMLEGRYLKLFKKLKLDKKYGLTFPEFLINLGTYLQESNEGNPLHFKYMDDYRRQVSKWRKDTIAKKLLEDYNIQTDSKLTHRDLVQMYIQAWVEQEELHYETTKMDKENP